MTTLPVISAAQNGSGVAAQRRDYYDMYGNLTWQMDERGFLTRTSYDVPTGAVTQRIDDVDTTQVSDAPPGWTTPAGGGLHLITDFLFDDEGRITQVLGPTHTIDLGGVATAVRRATWTVYHDGTQQVWTAQGYATGTAPELRLHADQPGLDHPARQGRPDPGVDPGGAGLDRRRVAADRQLPAVLLRPLDDDAVRQRLLPGLAAGVQAHPGERRGRAPASTTTRPTSATT